MLKLQLINKLKKKSKIQKMFFALKLKKNQKILRLCYEKHKNMEIEKHISNQMNKFFNRKYFVW